VDGYAILQPRSFRAARDSALVVFTAFRQRLRYRPLYPRGIGRLSGPVRGRFIHRQGIYDVDMFAKVMANRLPEDRILSHDLLEGTYCRSGLISDIQLVDEFPERYSEDNSRRYRWTRGDWQIAAWLAPRVPGSSKNRSVTLFRFCPS